jgi:hypothetical protein
MPSKRERRKRENARRRPVLAPHPETAGPETPRELLAAVAEEARRTAEPFLRGDGPPPGAEPLAKATLGVALRVIQQSPLTGKHACRAGCDFCCHTAVTAAPPQVFAIAAYLRAHYDAEELRQVREQIDRNASLAASMSRADYIAALIPCALRTPDGNCRAYPVRPLACAGFLSTSREACAAEFHRVPGRGPVPVDRHALAAGLGVSHGLKAACQQAGLDGEFYELHHALRRVWDEPEAAERWARGADVFGGCPR